MRPDDGPQLRGERPGHGIVRHPLHVASIDAVWHALQQLALITDLSQFEWSIEP